LRHKGRSARRSVSDTTIAVAVGFVIAGLIGALGFIEREERRKLE